MADQGREEASWHSLRRVSGVVVRQRLASSKVTRYGAKLCVPNTWHPTSCCARWAPPASMWKRPPTHTGFVDERRRPFSKGVQRIEMDDQTKRFLANIIQSLTTNSMRFTIPSALGHRGASKEKIMLQGHWKDPSMTANYLRDKRQITTDTVSPPHSSSYAKSGTTRTRTHLRPSRLAVKSDSEFSVGRWDEDASEPLVVQLRRSACSERESKP